MTDTAQIYSKLIRDYWLKKFAVASPVQNGLPGGGQAATDGHRSVNINLPATVVGRIRTIAMSHELVEYAVYLAFLYALLYRYYGARSVCVSTSDVRTEKSPATENHLLFFSLTGIDGQTTVRELLQIVLQEVQESCARKEFDLDQLCEALRRRDGDLEKLFQYGIFSNRVNAESEMFNRVALQLRIEYLDNLRTAVEIRFDPAQYGETWGAQLANHYCNLLACIEDNLDIKVGAAHMLSTKEKTQLLVQSGDASKPYETEKTIQELFEEQVERTPNAPAVIYARETLTYRELNEQANRLAHLLRSAYGIGRGDLVGLMLNRSELMLVGIMGILKAGAAYVPIDPAYPLARRSYLLDDGGVKAVLTENALTAGLDSFVTLDIRDERLVEQSASNPEPVSGASDLVYVIYTSGTTGHPKGVMVEHRAVVNLCAWLSSLIYRPHETPLRVSLNASTSFDSSIKQIFPPLLAGSTLVVIPEAAKHDLELFVETLFRQRVEVLDATPSYLSALLPVLASSEQRPDIKFTLAGGEALDAAIKSLYRNQFSPQSKLINVYGITESTVDSTFEVVGEGDDGGASIGRPIWNTQVYLLDDDLNLLPPGVAGEVCIGGAGLARGYLRRPKLTAERFLANPFSNRPGERLYRTGDIARWRADGTLEFLGRRDQQVKIRGYRIEPREVEHALLALDPVRQAFVTTAPDADGAPQLVAYYTAPEMMCADELRAQLQLRLPDHMLPAFIIQLVSFPLTAHGKIDPRALPPPASENKTEHIAPRTRLERELARVWGEILGVERVGLRDDFFALGGHSIKATRLVARLSRESGLRVELRWLFEHPTLEGFAAEVVARGVSENPQPIKVVDEQEHYELSHAQRRLWVLHQLEDSSTTAYTMAGAYRLDGELDRAALEWSLAALVRRHESLRTVFINVNGEPRQKVLREEDAIFALHYTDLRLHQDDETPAQSDVAESIFRRADEVALRAAATPFDLEMGELFRAHLVQVGDSRHVLALTIHHIISDGWSVALMIEEVLARYEARCEGRDAVSAPLRIQYKDYAAWQNIRLAAGELDYQRQYWHAQLGGELPTLDLSTDYVRPAVKSNRGSSVRRELGAELLEQLRVVSYASGASLFMGLVAGVSGLLWRLTGQVEAVFGIPVAGRVHAELEEQVGFYVNTLALRSGIAEGDSFGDLLESVRDLAVEAYEHQEYPFDLLVEELGVARDLSRSAVFDVMLVMQENRGSAGISGKWATGARHGSGLGVSEHKLPVGGSKFDLTFHFREHEQGLLVLIDYNTDLFTTERMERLLGHYEGLLRSAVAKPTEKLAHLEYLSADEKERSLYRFNRTHRVYPADTTVKDLFKAQVERTPAATAVVFNAERLTYAELDERANRLAHYLKTLGVGAEVAVGIMLERSIEMMVALLGVIKAGGAYVPLDPQHPQERLAFMIEDTGAQVILTQQKFVEGLPLGGAQSVTLDTDWPLIAMQSETEPADALDAANLVYVLYTSGSTGRPKGVMISHRGLVNYLDWAIDAYEVEKGCGTPVHTPLGFDLTITSIFPALLTGQRVVLLPEDEGVDGLLSALREGHDFSLVKLTPAHLEALGAQITDAEAGNWSRAFVVGGDALSAEQLQVWRENGSVTRFYNEYGPTETVVGCCVFEITGEAAIKGAVPIGRPIANTQLYVLDAHQKPLPVGAAGELYIGGEGLARGYRGRAGLTAERFIPHPFSETGGERLYRTGDVARWRADGTLEFLGRRDQQVKIRGYRIEPREVEHALLALDPVRQAFVTTAPDADGAPQLVAYYTASSEIPAVELYRHLKRLLPEYMLPAFYTFLETFPLTTNGKLDRRALPLPHRDDAESFVAPRTPLEQELARLWAEVLGVERIGLGDDFFRLGGHSLKATRLIGRLAQAIGLRVELRVLFLHSTLEEFAKAVAARSLREEFRPIEEVAEQEHYELSHAQRRLWILSQLEEATAAYTMAGAYRLDGNVARESLEFALKSVVERHESLRTVFITVDGEPRQKVRGMEETAFALRYTVMQGTYANIETELTEALRQEADAPFDLARGPLLRAHLICTGAERYVLALAMPHIISDGWSVGLLIEEMLSLYEAHRQGQNSALPPLKIQYKNYAAWQNKRLRSGQLTKQRIYWHELLGKDLPVLELATDYARPTVKSHRAKRARRRMGADLNAALKNFSRQAGASVFMSLASGLSSLLLRYTQQPEIVFGAPVAGRVHAGLEDQIGFYVNTLALRVKMEESDSFESLVERVKRQTLASYEHQEYPFDLLVEELGIARDLSRSAVFDVMLVMQNTQRRELHGESVANLCVTECELPVRGSKFDLTFYFHERPEHLDVVLDYNADLFERQRMEQLLEHYERLLQAATSAPSKELARIEYLTARERAQLLEEFNPQSRVVVPMRTVQQLFETQVARTPEAVALVCGPVRLTFCQLNEQANRLAHLLRDVHRIEPGHVVAFQLARSEKLIVTMLGIIKAGAAYLPIDMQQPGERMKFILKDSRARILVTDTPTPLRPEGCERLSWDDELFSIVEMPSNDPPAAAQPDDDVYVIYTSGTTGLPKGTAIRHRSLVNYLNWFVTSFGIGVDDSTVLLSSVAFDLPYTALWSSLVAGSVLHVLPETQFFEPEALISILKTHGITYLKLTPAHFHMILLDGLGTEVIADYNLRLIVTGGEEVNPQDIATYLSQHPQTLFVNHYGPTETTVGTIAIPITLGELDEFKNRPVIGKPIWNNCVYILDRQLNLLPVGAVGEICISGAGVARDYLNREDLTAERFVPNPYAEKDHEILYHTGDLGKWLANGTVQFLGRKDHQVKVRGYRIELAEVESALLRHPAVEQVLVSANRDVARAQHLRAYLAATAPLKAADLRAFLKTHLPDYMIPSSFSQLAHLPLTANGKIDRQTLEALETDVLEPADDYVSPGSPLEEQLVIIWGEILDKRSFGVTDNFFESGGNSLLATQVTSRIARDLHINIKLRTLFMYPTIRSLAEEIVAQTPTPYVVIEPVAPQTYYPVSHAQKRLWVLDQLSPEQVAYNMPGGFVLEGEIDIEAFASAFMALIARHETLRTTFIVVDGEPKQIIHAPESTGFKFVSLDLRGASDNERRARRMAEEDAAIGFDLERGPLVRARLVRLRDDRFVFLFNMHHIISDGWSRSVLVKEMLALYSTLRSGQDNPLPPLRIQYKDFAAWQESRLQGEYLDRLVSYWVNKLGDLPPPLALPLDYPRPPVQTFDGDHFRFTIDAATTAALVELANRRSTTLFTAVLSSYLVFLYHATRQRRIVIGTSVAGRSHSDLEPLIGFFINTLAIKIDVNPQSTFSDFLVNTHQELFEDFERQDLPFDLLVQRLGIKRNASLSPVFQSRFVFNDLEATKHLDAMPPAAGVRIVETFVGGKSAKFDLSTLMWPEGDGLAGHMEYRTALFKRETIQRLCRQFQTMLQNIVAAPETRIDHFSFASAEDIVGEKNRKDAMLKGKLALLKGNPAVPSRTFKPPGN